MTTPFRYNYYFKNREKNPATWYDNYQNITYERMVYGHSDFLYIIESANTKNYPKWFWAHNRISSKSRLFRFTGHKLDSSTFNDVVQLSKSSADCVVSSFGNLNSDLDTFYYLKVDNKKCVVTAEKAELIFKEQISLRNIQLITGNQGNRFFIYNYFDRTMHIANLEKSSENQLIIRIECVKNQENESRNGFRSEGIYDYETNKIIFFGQNFQETEWKKSFVMLDAFDTISEKWTKVKTYGNEFGNHPFPLRGFDVLYEGANVIIYGGHRDEGGFHLLSPNTNVWILNLKTMKWSIFDFEIFDLFQHLWFKLHPTVQRFFFVETDHPIVSVQATKSLRLEPESLKKLCLNQIKSINSKIFDGISGEWLTTDPRDVIEIAYRFQNVEYLKKKQKEDAAKSVLNLPKRKNEKNPSIVEFNNDANIFSWILRKK